MSTNLYTSSRLRVLRQCLRLHYFRYVLGAQTPMGDSARFGVVGHAALEAWLLAWKAGQLDERLALALGRVAVSDLSPFDKARLAALVTAYHLRWKDEPWEILAVETEFRYELGGHLIGGKVDAIIRNTTDGCVYVLEHKTTGQDASPGSAYWDRLSIDTQVSIYVDGATMLGHEIGGVVYDVLQRPRHEVRLATPEAERQYTQGKGCQGCGGKTGVQGSGKHPATTSGICALCGGNGWKEAPRLHARMRDVDESLDEYTERVIEEIAAKPDSYLIRGVVVRLEDELPRMRQDLIDSIEIEQAATARNVHPRNPEQCQRYGSLCPFFEVCAHRADITDTERFPRGRVHPELADAA